MTWEELQGRAEAWHRRRFDNAVEPMAVGLKLGSEVGEVHDALIFDWGSNSARGKGDVAGECADVAICLMVLLGRWYQDVDLMAEVAKKLEILETPNMHQSSVTS